MTCFSQRGYLIPPPVVAKEQVITDLSTVPPPPPIHGWVHRHTLRLHASMVLQRRSRQASASRSLDSPSSRTKCVTALRAQFSSLMLALQKEDTSPAPPQPQFNEARGSTGPDWTAGGRSLASIENEAREIVRTNYVCCGACLFILNSLLRSCYCSSTCARLASRR